MIHFIVGTEAELIKIFPLMIELKKHKKNYNFIATGQHNLASSEVLTLFELKKPDIVLYSGKPFTSIPAIIVWFIKIIIKSQFNFKKIFMNDKRGLVIVHGDTPSTLLGAILTRMSGLKLGHLEAGLKSKSLINPFPEELTRRMVSRLSHIYFCPGQWAYANLASYKGKRINMEYNTLLDSFRYIRKYLAQIKIPQLPRKYFVFILHRHEALYAFFNRKTVIKLIEVLHQWSLEMPGIFIVHHTTAARLKKYGLIDKIARNGQIRVMTRQSYPKFMKILYGAEFIATDGGSNQEESYYMGLPALILRKNTERKEGINHNVVLSELDFKKIYGFFNTYNTYCKKPMLIKDSPSRKIFNYLANNKI